MYLTLMNVVTNKSVPFGMEKDGAFVIRSSNPLDTEDNVQVQLTNTFHEFSMDYMNFYSKSGIIG